ncbi:hypothetical protein Ddc_11467 [Ditylenchus destructor]|nr:hypothetical protein Ddc_11467 [Ditylenchus destructor]
METFCTDRSAMGKQKYPSHIHYHYMETLCTDRSAMCSGIVSLSNEQNGQWRREIQPLQQATTLIEQRRGGNAQAIRKKLTEYISGVGAVGWQDEYL